MTLFWIILSVYLVIFVLSMITWLAIDTKTYVRQALESNSDKTKDFDNPPVDDAGFYAVCGLIWPLGWIVFIGFNLKDWLSSVKMFDAKGKISAGKALQAQAARDKKELEELKREIEHSVIQDS